MAQYMIRNGKVFGATPDKGSLIGYDNTSSGRTPVTIQGAVDRAFDEIDLMSDIINSGGILISQSDYNLLEAAGHVDMSATYYITDATEGLSAGPLEITKAEYDALTDVEREGIVYFCPDWAEGSTVAELEAGLSTTNTNLLSLAGTQRIHTVTLTELGSKIDKVTGGYTDISSQCAVTFVNGTLTSATELSVIYKMVNDATIIKFYARITGTASGTYMRISLPSSLTANFTWFGSLPLQSGSAECNGVDPRSRSCYIQNTATNYLVVYLGTATLSSSLIWGTIEVW